MSDREFSLFSAYIYRELGIKMPQTKMIMLTTRLAKRVRALGLSSFEEYYNYLQTSADSHDEYNLMVDAVTTNKTEFFREDKHFAIMTKEVLPKMMSESEAQKRKSLHVWCAGCSTGEEAYTIAFVLEDFFSGNGRWNYHILATDISRRVLHIAKNAIYNDDVCESIPPAMRRKYLMRGKGDMKGFHKIVPEIRKKITFHQLNFMDDDFKIGHKMDIIFCRNVVIYFDKQTQVAFFSKLHDILSPGGYLFIGSSETLFGINDRFKSVGATVYRRV